MRARLPRLLSAVLLACLAWRAAAAEPPAPVSNKVDLSYDVQADGQYTMTAHLQRTAGTIAGAQMLAQFPWQYDPSREQVKIVSAYVLKADGRKLPVEPLAIQDQSLDAGATAAPPVVGRARLIPFFDIGVGDSIVVDLRQHVFKPRLAGLFSQALFYDRSQAWDARVSVTVPDSMTLRSEAVGPRVVEDGSDHTYSWHYQSTTVLADDPGALAAIERLPRLVLTTAADWQQVGRLYAALALPLAKVTPDVRKTADAVATGLADHRAIAERLFTWVRDRIRYQPGPVEQGGMAPHAADAVLASRAGDSGDKAVLLMALLAAKGVASDLVLIDTDAVYRLGVAAPFAQLNHVLLYLPALDAYADPSATTSDIGRLPFGAVGKPAIFAVASGPVVHETPLPAPGAATLIFATTARLSAHGMIDGTSVTTATGPFADGLLLAAGVFAAPHAQDVAMQQLSAVGERGTGGFDLPPRPAPNGGVTLSGHFAVSLWPQLSPDDRLLLPDGLRAQPRTGDLLIGPMDTLLPDEAPTPCYPGRESDTISLDLGTAYRVVRLPADRTIDGGAFTYTSRWSQQGSTVTVRRVLDSRVTTPVCDGALRQATAAALRAITADYVARVAVQRVAAEGMK